MSGGEHWTVKIRVKQEHRSIVITTIKYPCGWETQKQLRILLPIALCLPWCKGETAAEERRNTSSYLDETDKH